MYNYHSNWILITCNLKWFTHSSYNFKLVIDIAATSLIRLQFFYFEGMAII